MLEHFYQRGVRLLTIAWDDNAFCGIVFGNKGRLTKLGEELIRYCNELWVIVDVSHASDKAFYEIAAITKIPFLASHSNARAVCPNDWNISDDMIKLIADAGGLIGLTYVSGFIQPEYGSTVFPTWSWKWRNRGFFPGVLIRSAMGMPLGILSIYYSDLQLNSECVIFGS